MNKPGLWKWLLPAAALFAAACGGDDETPIPNENTGQTEKPGGETPPPVDDPDIYTVYPSGSGCCRDTPLALTFETQPQLGTTGTIRIFRADGVEVDRIEMADVAAEREQMTSESLFTTAMDALGCPQAGRYRIVHYDPVRVDGRTVIIKPHARSLEHGVAYYVTVDKEAIAAEGFEGIARGAWNFTTGPAPASKSSVTVGHDGCDFRTVQAAVDYAYSCGRDQAVTIEVKNGIYEEQLYIRGKNNLTIRGESRDGVVIRYDNCESYASGVGGNVGAVPAPGSAIGKSGGRAVVLMENCDMVRFEQLTLENSHGPGSQAEALYNNDNNGTGRLLFIGCNILSAQDTFNLKGFGWFYDCLVAGDVDFIWGGPDTVLFEGCEIRSVNGGYIVQARCAAGKKGFVFLDCDLTQAPGGNGKPVYLARSSGNASYRDNVAFVNCRIGAHVATAGWYENPLPTPSKATAADGWKEYGLTDASGGAFATTSSCKHRLSTAEYEAGYKDRRTIFASCPKGTDWLTE